MKTKTLKSKVLFLCALLAAVALLPVSAWADSTRVAPESGWAVHDYVMERVADGYHGGLDIGYAQVATGTAAAKTRCILKSENYGGGIGGPNIRVSLYDYTGKPVERFGEVTGLTSAWAQAVRLSPDQTQIIYSYTDYVGGGDFYSIQINPETLTPVLGASPQQPFSVPMKGNWEMEYDPISGAAFVAGKITQWGPDTHSIWVWDADTSNWQEVVDVTGWSCGFAFDLYGNLWTGTYTSSGPMDVQYVRMYTATQIENAVLDKEVLLPGDFAAEIALPHDDDEGWWMGANDLECGPDGTIYVSCNSGWTMAYNSEVGFTVRIENNGRDTTEDDMEILSVSIPTDDSDWQKSMAYDGESYLDDPTASAYTDPTQDPPTANRLFIDQDTMAQGAGADIVTVLAVDSDFDTDGVPDATDNAPESPNTDQRDTDRDMYGNMVDADFNNSGSVNYADKAIFGQAFSTTYNEDCDFDGNGSVTYFDKAKFGAKFGTSAPWF